MKKAFKTYAHAPSAQAPASIPSDWPWFVADITDESEADFAANGFIVLSYDGFNQYKLERQAAFDAWANAYDQDKEGERLRVLDLVQETFASYHPSKIDFRRHLKTDVYLQKNVVMLPNGRPEHALYSYNGELIAEIDFVFETNEMNFMTRRKEILYYYKASGQKGEGYTIADDLYDASNPYHLREMMKERSESRSLIIEEIKAFLNGVLAAAYIPQGCTYTQILELAGSFWSAHYVEINSWINVGSPQFSTAIQNNVQFAFLNNEVSEGVTVRDYILQKISY